MLSISPSSVIDCHGLLRRPRNDKRTPISTYKDDVHPGNCYINDISEQARN